MALYFIGLGLGDEKDITLKGFELVKSADTVYLENYTSKLNCKKEDLEKLYNKEIILADREMVEKNPESTILKDAKEKNTAFLVVGDPFGATTHLDLLTRAKKLNIETKIIHNASILTAIGVTGLQIYKFGKTTSIPFETESFHPETPYNVLKENKTSELHTLLLLDLKPKQNKFMTIKQAINYLLKIEEKKKQNIFTKDTLCIGCAGIGTDEQNIKAGKAEELINHDFGKSLHCLIIPGKMHFAEKEAVQQF